MHQRLRTKRSLAIGGRAGGFLGLLVALLWIGAALPDIVATFVGDRVDNEVTFTPVWLKAIRDLVTLAAVFHLGRKANTPGKYCRAITGLLALFYAGFGLYNGADALISVRGVVWVFPLVWAATSGQSCAQGLAAFSRTIVRWIVPVAIACSLALGFFGKDIYFESVGNYQRNPGLFLTPSATAFFAILAVLYASGIGGNAKLSSFVMGLMTLSGIFYINLMLCFGRLPRYLYLLCGTLILVALAILGIDDYINLISRLASGARESIAIQLTLATRLLTLQDAVSRLSWFGNYPVGLNVAANNGLDQFFPDNAFLAAIYAFGFIGIGGTIWLLVGAWRAQAFSLFLLLFTASFFYVWFESSLFAALVGCLLNPCVVEAANHGTSSRARRRTSRPQPA